MLNLHNNLRKNIQEGTIPNLPPAKNMSLISWDVGLENECKRWIKLCPSTYKVIFIIVNSNKIMIRVCTRTRKKPKTRAGFKKIPENKSSGFF